jgi:hypothetical protein
MTSSESDSDSRLETRNRPAKVRSRSLQSNSRRRIRRRPCPSITYEHRLLAYSVLELDDGKESQGAGMLAEVAIVLQGYTSLRRGAEYESSSCRREEAPRNETVHR